MTRKRTDRRIPKETRKNSKFWAEGARESILMPHVEPYADAAVRGWKSERDYWQLVCNEYHTRIDWRLEDWEEPSLPLPPYDPAIMRVHEVLTPQEQVRKLANIKRTNDRIRRWLKTRVKKLRHLWTPSKVDPRKNPYTVLIAKLSGINAPPKARQAYQQFMVESYLSDIDPAVQRKWRNEILHGRQPADSRPTTAFRAKVSREVFDQLPAATQTEYLKKAREEAAVAKDKYEADMKSPPPMTPAAIQSRIDNIPSFLGPVIEGIQERTGLKFFVMYGGPCPMNQGEVTAWHMNFGFNNANQPTPFSQFRKEEFKQGTYALWREWLGTCYTLDDIEQAALLDNEQPPEVNCNPSDSSSEEEPSDTEEEDDSTDQRSKKRPRLQGSGKKLSKPTARTTAPPTTTSIPPPPLRSNKTARSIPTTSKPSLLADLIRKSHANDPKSGENPTITTTSPSSIPPSTATPASAAAVARVRTTSHPTDVSSSSNLPNSATSSNTTPSSSNASLATPGLAYSPSSSESSASQTGIIPTPTTTTTSTSPLTNSGTSSPTGGSRRLSPAKSAHSSPIEAQETMSNSRPDVTEKNDDGNGPPPKRRKVSQPLLGNPTAFRSEVVVPSTTRLVPSTTRRTSSLSRVISPLPRAVFLSPRTASSSAATISSLPLAPVVSTSPTTHGSSPAPPVSPDAPQPRSSSSSANPIFSNSTQAPSASSSPANPILSNSTQAPCPASLPPSQNANPLLSCPPSAADWVKEAFKSVTARDLGQDFAEIVRLFMAIETAHNYDNPSRGFPAKCRPVELTRWIGSGRWRGNPPPVRDVAKFSDSWWAWWISLQPSWRKYDAGGKPVLTTYGDSWDCLIFPGQNGVLSLVACLSWWGCAIADQSPDGYSGSSADWQKAVLDVGWMLNGLVHHLG